METAEFPMVCVRRHAALERFAGVHAGKEIRLTSVAPIYSTCRMCPFTAARMRLQKKR